MAGHFGANPYKWEYPGQANNPHTLRYLLARGIVFPWETVLDAACATGYGSKLLALNAKKVYGYEVDEGCIAVAKQNCPDNCEFLVKDLSTCELPDVDVSVSIETIEHVLGLEHFIDQLHKHTKRCIVACVPVGGTSQFYKNYPPGPASEKNDFPEFGDVDRLLAPEGSEWKVFNCFQFGPSQFGVYFKDQIHVPKDWQSRIGSARDDFYD